MSYNMKAKEAEAARSAPTLVDAPPSYDYTSDDDSSALVEKTKSLNANTPTEPRKGQIADIRPVGYGAVAPAYYNLDTDVKKSHKCCESCCCGCCTPAEGECCSPCCKGFCALSCCLFGIGIIVSVVFLGLYIHCQANKVSDHFSHSLPANSSFTDFVLHSHNGNLNIDASSAYTEITLKFEATFAEESEMNKFKKQAKALAVKDGVIELSVGDDNNDYTWWCPDIVDVTVQLPADTPADADYEFHTTNGHVTASNIVGAAVEISTSNGNMDVSLITAESLNCNTRNGEVTATQIETTDGAAFESSNGRMDITSLTVGGTVMVHTTNGHVTLTTTTAGGVQVSSSNGEIDISSVTADEFDIHTTNGAVKGDAELTGKNDCEFTAITSNGNVNFDKLSAGPNKETGCDVTFKTTNGDVDVSLQGFNGRYSTTTSNGKVRTSGKASGGKIGSGSGDDEFSFTTSNGDITLSASN